MTGVSWRRVATACLGLALLAACASPAGPRDPTGQVTATATVDTYSLQVGDCTGPIPSGNATQFTLIPCGDKHNWEAFARTTLKGDAFPGAKAVGDAAAAFCGDAFTTFIGVKRSKSAYELTYLQPTKASWEGFGDREIVCLAGRSAGNVTGSLDGVERPTATPTK